MVHSRGEGFRIDPVNNQSLTQTTKLVLPPQQNSFKKTQPNHPASSPPSMVRCGVAPHHSSRWVAPAPFFTEVSQLSALQDGTWKVFLRLGTSPDLWVMSTPKNHGVGTHCRKVGRKMDRIWDHQSDVWSISWYFGNSNRPPKSQRLLSVCYNNHCSVAHHLIRGNPTLKKHQCGSFKATQNWVWPANVEILRVKDRQRTNEHAEIILNT